MENQKPYHVEARELGADIKNVKKLPRVYRKYRGGMSPTAAQILAVWDYRRAALDVDQAREYVKKWNRPSYHQYPRGNRQRSEHVCGRILTMFRIAEQRRIKYEQYIARDEKLSDGELSWQNPIIIWSAGGRKIKTIRTENVTWGDRKHPQWPESKTVSHTSYLIRTDWPGTIDFYETNENQFCHLAAEKKITHNLRGNWRQHVLDALLPGEKLTPPPVTRYKSVAIIDGRFYSIYDGSVEYILGVRLHETVKPEHGGGYYCYASKDEARHAEVPPESVYYNAPRAVLRCEVGGKTIKYGKKLCYSWIMPIEVI